MIASAIYYLIIKDRDWYFGRKFSLGILSVFAVYYILYYGVIKNTIYENWLYWVIGLDIFVLGVLLMKYKHLKFGSFIDRAVSTTL